jgi:hypothetical protein
MAESFLSVSVCMQFSLSLICAFSIAQIEPSMQTRYQIRTYAVSHCLFPRLFPPPARNVRNKANFYISLYQSLPRSSHLPASLVVSVIRLCCHEAAVRARVPVNFLGNTRVAISRIIWRRCHQSIRYTEPICNIPTKSFESRKCDGSKDLAKANKSASNHWAVLWPFQCHDGCFAIAYLIQLYVLSPKCSHPSLFSSKCAMMRALYAHIVRSTLLPIGPDRRSRSSTMYCPTGARLG